MSALPIPSPAPGSGSQSGPEDREPEVQFRFSQAEVLAGGRTDPGTVVEELGIVKGVAQYLIDMRAED